MAAKQQTKWFVVGFVGALMSIAVIVAIISTTRGVPTWSGALVGVALIALVAWQMQRTSHVAGQVLAVMKGKGAMTITEISAALDDKVKRGWIVSSLARMRVRGQVTREEIVEPQGPDTHRYTVV